jgi:predicted ArsR family transcriptional regulator
MPAPNWIERLAGSTRGALLVLLRRSRHTIAELSSALRITDNAVRTHIAALQRDGLVEQVGFRRDLRGKPAHVFDLTESAEELFPKAYAAVLGELIDRLEARDGAAGAEALLRDAGWNIGSQIADPAQTLRARVDAAAALLTTLGGELVVEESGTGFEVRGHGCPLSAVVRGHHTTCVVAEALIASATGGDVREHCDKGARPRCAFHVAPPAMNGGDDADGLSPE